MVVWLLRCVLGLELLGEVCLGFVICLIGGISCLLALFDLILVVY